MSHICDYCHSEYESHACPNCGAPAPVEVNRGIDTDGLRYSSGARYGFGWCDPRAPIMRVGTCHNDINITHYDEEKNHG